MRKYLIVLSFMVILINSAGCKNSRDPGFNGASDELSKVPAMRDSIELKIESTGRVVANLDVEIKCKASGEVINLPFDVSDEVKKGDLVVELDPIEEQRNVNKAKVSLSASQARLDKARLNLEIAESDLASAKKKAEVDLEVAISKANDARAKADRIKALLEQKLRSQEEYETAEIAALNAEANVESARIRIEELKTEESALELRRQDLLLAKTDLESTQISLTLAEQRLTDTKVYAPIDGIVTDRQVQTGQIISSGISNVGGGTTVLTLSDLSRLFVLASVDESDIGRIEPGQQVHITADAYLDKSFTGIVERIAQKGINKSNVVTFEVRIEVTSENKSLLKPEMTTNVEIMVANVKDAIIVPVGAVFREKGVPKVTVENPDGSIEDREVEVGINNGETIEIISGVNEGDMIVLRSAEYESQWRKRFENSSRNRPPGPPGGFRRH